MQRDPNEMHWHLWEAVRLEASEMFRLGLISNILYNKVRYIDQEVKQEGAFTTKLRTLACELEEEIKPFENKLAELLNDEQHNTELLALTTHESNEEIDNSRF